MIYIALAVGGLVLLLCLALVVGFVIKFGRRDPAKSEDKIKQKPEE